MLKRIAELRNATDSYNTKDGGGDMIKLENLLEECIQEIMKNGDEIQVLSRVQSVE